MMSSRYMPALLAMVMFVTRMDGSVRAEEWTDLSGVSECIKSIQDGSESNDLWIEAGRDSGSLVLLASSTSLRIGGFAKVDSIYDFEDAGNRYLFDPNSIPIEDQLGPQYTITANQTRLNLETRTPSDYGTLRTFIEGDFFGDNDRIRLRHAYGELGNFLAGQTWIPTMDADAIPETLDFNGPDGSTTARRPQLRWTQHFGDAITWTFSTHDSRPGGMSEVPGENRNLMPVFGSSLRFKSDVGHIYLGGGFGDSRFVPTVGNPVESEIWGLFFSILRRYGRDSLIAQVGFFQGFTELPSLAGEASNRGRLDALPGQGGVIAFQHVWSDAFRSNFAYRAVAVDNLAAQSKDSINSNKYLATNLIWSPLRNSRVDIGIEYLWGMRSNKDGTNADAHRVLFSARFRLPG